MPGFDKTGPKGQGPYTGGAFGRCAGAETAEDSIARGRGGSYGIGRGGKTRGGGRGRCFGGGNMGRGMGRSNFDDEQTKTNAELLEKMTQLIQENEKLRSKLAELESSQEKQGDGSTPE